MYNRKQLEAYLFYELKKQLPIPANFTDELIHANLIYLFSRDDQAAINWARFIENEFGITIPGNEIDYFFLASTGCMATTILTHISPTNTTISDGYTEYLSSNPAHSAR